MTESVTARFERLEGQLAAAGMALNLFIELHPDPAELVAAIHARSEKLQSTLLAKPVPDAVLQGAQSFVDQWLVKPRT